MFLILLTKEEEYNKMVLDKTGGLFRLAVGLMQVMQASTQTSDSKEQPDYTSLLDKLSLYFQIRDDFVNISRYYVF